MGLDTGPEIYRKRGTQPQECFSFSMPRIDDINFLLIEYLLSYILAVYGMFELATRLRLLGQVHPYLILQY